MAAELAHPQHATCCAKCGSATYTVIRDDSDGLIQLSAREVPVARHFLFDPAMESSRAISAFAYPLHVCDQRDVEIMRRIRTELVRKHFRVVGPYGMFDAAEFGTLDELCPACRAEPTKPCTDLRKHKVGEPIKRLHRARFDRALITQGLVYEFNREAFGWVVRKSSKAKGER